MAFLLTTASPSTTGPSFIFTSRAGIDVGALTRLVGVVVPVSTVSVDCVVAVPPTIGRLVLSALGATTTSAVLLKK